MSDPRPAIVGIDLGTTYSLVAVLQQGVPVVLPNALGELLTPSAVSVEDGERVLVGAPARARATTHPVRTALAFKRDMGTSRVFELGPKRMTPQDLSALVLQTLRRDAEVALGLPVEEAVVTVPAYFGDAQRQATRDAGAIAGLKVERILNEPTAAALAYGLHERHREMRVAVVDLGGGTFDVTVLEIIEGVIEIHASSGDSRLGGEDFVDQLADRLAAGAREEMGIDLMADVQGRARVREACEEGKRRLSDAEATRIVLADLPVGGGRRVNFERTVTRGEAELSWQPLIERLRAPILRALRDAQTRPEQIDEVLLVGGATRMPCVLRLVAQLFGRMPLRKLPPDEAVAMGAAVQAGLKARDRALDDMVVTDVAPFTMGIGSATRMGRQIVEGLFSPILERGTVIPASRVERFSTMTDDQREIRIEVYQGEHSLCRDNRKLGEFSVHDLQRGRAGEQAVDVRFTYDLNGILEVEATAVSTGRKETLVIEKSPGRLTPEQIREAREAMQRLKFHPRAALPNATALARADALYVELTGLAREELGAAIANLRAVLETQDPVEIERLRQGLVALVASLRGAPAAG